MRVFLQNKRTKLYVRGFGEWVQRREQAADFGSSWLALDFAVENKLADLEIVFSFEDRRFDFRLPVRGR